jgi:hypothetical protein
MIGSIEFSASSEAFVNLRDINLDYTNFLTSTLWGQMKREKKLSTLAHEKKRSFFLVKAQLI